MPRPGRRRRRAGATRGELHRRIQHDRHCDPYDAECGTDRARRVGLANTASTVSSTEATETGTSHLEQVGRGRHERFAVGAATDRRPAEHARSPAAASDADRPQTGPPPAGPPLPPVAPPPRPPRRGFPWLLVGGAVVLLIAAIAATAAITYAVARNTNAPNATPPPAAPTAQAPQFSTAEQNAAKQQLCQVFDISTQGQQGQGGVRINGEAEPSSSCCDR